MDDFPSYKPLLNLLSAGFPSATSGGLALNLVSGENCEEGRQNGQSLRKQSRSLCPKQGVTLGHQGGYHRGIVASLSLSLSLYIYIYNIYIYISISMSMSISIYL